MMTNNLSVGAPSPARIAARRRSHRIGSIIETHPKQGATLRAGSKDELSAVHGNNLVGHAQADALAGNRLVHALAALQDNIDLFRAPDMISFIQMFFDPDVRDEATLDDANRVLAELTAAGVPDPEALQAGDRFMLPSYFESATELEVRKRLGSGFAQALAGLDPGAWHGPVLSGFGVHLVYIFERVQTPAPALADVRPQVLEGWQREEMDTFSKKFYESLKSRYTIVVEDAGLAPDSVLEPRKSPASATGAEQ